METPMATRGIHLVWTTYGTWLPGDDRGHWSPLFDLYGHLTAAGHKLNIHDVATKHRAAEALTEPPKSLTPAEIDIVTGVIADCVGVDKLHPIAAAIEPTHVHLLIGPTATDTSTIVGRMKGRSSSAVCAACGRKRTWTAGYWQVFLFDDTGVAAVQRYIERHNERRGLPAAPFAWLRSI
jgi:REP element-mobilizing transposase RayT